jgi:hypothetical protein
VEGNKRYHAIDMHRLVGRISEIRRLRCVYTNRLLTLLTVVLMRAMFVCLTANIIVFVLRLYYPPWPYNLYVLASAWLAIAVTLGAAVAQAVFRRGRVTYHRIVGAILLYLLITVLFGTLFIFVGVSIPDAIKGITFEDNAALANSVFYLSFVTLTSTGYGDIVPVHPIARTLCILETVIGQLYPATLLARIVTLEMRQGSD